MFNSKSVSVSLLLLLTACSSGNESSTGLDNSTQVTSESDSSNNVNNMPVELDDSMDMSIEETTNSADSFDIVTAGTFFNIASDIGGTWIMPLKADNGSLQGSFDASQPEGAKTALCGAGNISTQIANGEFAGQFPGNDSDLGCFFDTDWIFDIEGQVDNDASGVNGTYRIIDETGAFIADGQNGIFETWTDNRRPMMQRYEGEMQNTTFGIFGILQIDIEIGERTVSGYLDFDEHPGETRLCGAGYFAGLIEPANTGNWTIHATFESKDLDEGCGLADGLHFALDATLDSSRTTLDGVYSVNSGQGGEFTTQLKN